MLGKLRDRLFDYSNSDSFVNRVRRKRVAHFMGLLTRLPGGPPLRILDIGGTCRFWTTSVGTIDPARMRITLLNLTRTRIPDQTQAFSAMVGDALNLPFADGAFDIVFSNSVIEHMGSKEGQYRMADEVRRVGRRFYIQTPSLWFPLEPHCHIPGFQFWPRRLRAMAIRTGKVHYFPGKPTIQECLTVSDSTILLTRNGVRALFPEADICAERLFGMVKSYAAMYGWPEKRV